MREASGLAVAWSVDACVRQQGGWLHKLMLAARALSLRVCARQPVFHRSGEQAVDFALSCTDYSVFAAAAGEFLPACAHLLIFACSISPRFPAFALPLASSAVSRS